MGLGQGVAAPPPRFRERSLGSPPSGFNRITHTAGFGTNFGWIRSPLFIWSGRFSMANILCMAKRQVDYAGVRSSLCAFDLVEKEFTVHHALCSGDFYQGEQHGNIGVPSATMSAVISLLGSPSCGASQCRSSAIIVYVPTSTNWW